MSIITNENEPQQLVPSELIGQASEQQRVTAEIQSALAIAASRPRDEVACIDKISNSCQRPGLAAISQYTYNRGGTEITGPSIDLLQVVANHWGHIKYGFRELSVDNNKGESVVECFAWDMESNSQTVRTITVPHVRVTRSSRTRLTDPRDIYELIANSAQRRVRACLESIIPRDVVQEAVHECNRTLKASAPVNKESLKALLAAFKKFKVTRAMIEARIQRHLESMTSGQLVRLRQIYSSLDDGMSQVEDHFKDAVPSKAAKAPAKKTAKEKVAAKAKQVPPKASKEDEEKAAQIKQELAELESMPDEPDFDPETSDPPPPPSAELFQTHRTDG